MKNFWFIFLTILAFFLSGCFAFDATTPWGDFSGKSDPGVTVYTDVDVAVKLDPKNQMKTITIEDTSIIKLSVKENAGTDVPSVFKGAVESLKQIYTERVNFCKAWVGQ